MTQNGPDKNTIYPLAGYERLCFLKNIIKNPNIIVGDYTYYDDFEDVHNFEKNVKYHFDFTGDKLIIGKFCMIASDVKFIMNGANHLTDALSTYPFAIFGSGWEKAMEGRQYPYKGDLVIGNDVWIGREAMIMKGLSIGTGAIIGARSVVTRDVPAYAIVVGVPARIVKYRHTPETVARLLCSKWWEVDPEVLKRLPSNDPDKFLEEISSVNRPSAYRKVSLTRDTWRISS